MPSGPKANKYTNRHSAEANERKEERRVAEKAAKAAAAEDAQWAEKDPKALKRLEKEREEAQKEQERATRELLKKAQLQEEEKELSAKAPKKVTQRQLQKDLSKMLADYDKQQQAMRRYTDVVEVSKDELPAGNVNRERGVAEPTATVEASGSTGAVLLALEKGGMSAGGGGPSAAAEIPDNRHIGKRAKVLYKNFYQEHIDTVKEERPGLRRTQYNDVIWEMWQKSPLNPFVARSEMRDRERLEEERRWMEGSASDDEEDGDNNEDKEAAATK